MFRYYFKKLIGWIVGIIILGIIGVVLYAKYGG